MSIYQDIHRHPNSNYLLDALDKAASRNLFSQMESVLLVHGKIVQEPGTPSRHAYFPTTCVVSLLCGIENGCAAETAVIGNEGVVGITNIIGDDISQTQAVVQSTGYAYRIRTSALQHEFQNNSELQMYLLKYLHALIAQMAQTAACNRHHPLEQQLCRWFLHNLDRLPSNELIVTQEFIAHILGVRREGVTNAAVKLQRDGIINYRRGRISIINRDALEERACECYGIVRKEYERILPIKLREFTPDKKVMNG